MHSAAVAEWILSLVAPPDRAASTVGDLVEEARGTLWFWSCVLRTAGSHLWHDLTVSPLGMLRLAVWGFLTYWFVGLLIVGFVTQVSIDILNHLGPDGSVISPPLWVYSLLKVLVCTAIPFLVGWKVARSSDGREMAAAVAVAVLFSTLYLLIGRPGPGVEYAALALSVIAGAILFRLRHKTAHSRVLSNPTT